MKIAFGSDLHQEFWSRPSRLRPLEFEYGGPSPIGGDGTADVLIAAGDIDVGPGAPKWLRETYGDDVGEIVYLPGNHEFYRQEVGKLMERLREQCEVHRVHLLEYDRMAEFKGLRIVGATLWTDYEYGGDRPLNLAVADNCMSDHRLIKIRKGEGDYRRFSSTEALLLHRQHRAWIMGTLAEPFVGKTVVATHHAPHHNSIAPEYATSDLNAAYCSDILESPLPGPCDLWIHGHVHARQDYTINGVRVVANPRGYPGELHNRAEQYEWRVIEI